MLADFQKLAIDKVRDNARNKTEECSIYLGPICKQFSVDIEKTD